MLELENYCEVGCMVCDIFGKLGTTCKVGVRTADCPQKKRQLVKKKKFDINLISVDQPFNYEEVLSITGPDYINNLPYGGVPPYEELKRRHTL